MMLDTLAPDRDRSERTRARCHARLQKLQPQPRQAGTFAFAGFSALYFLMVAFNALRMLIR